MEKVEIILKPYIYLFINADGIIGQTGELLGHNLFPYCMNNPVNMSDEYGFRPIYTMGEETEEMYEASIVHVSDKSANLVKIKYGEHDYNIESTSLYNDGFKKWDSNKVEVKISYDNDKFLIRYMVVTKYNITANNINYIRESTFLYREILPIDDKKCIMREYLGIEM